MCEMLSAGVASMRIVVFTPTNSYGGLDVTWSSLARQTMASRITWVVADDLLSRRANLYTAMRTSGELADVVPISVPHVPGYPSNLTSCYIRGMRLAREMNADIFISLQDYIYIDPHQVESFVEMARENPNDLGTGLCSITDNPAPEQVRDPHGLYTVFDEPFTSRPTESLWWSDYEMRGQGKMNPPGVYDCGHPYCWELNWAYVPRTLLHDDSLNFDPEFDRGLSKDHHVYAQECMLRRGARVIIDTRNHALGLPHKLYFPEATEKRERLGEINVAYARERYGI